MKLLNAVKRLVLFALLLVALGVAALGGGAFSDSHSSAAGTGAHVAYADDCDGVRPPPDFECPEHPTPTPTPTTAPGN